MGRGDVHPSVFCIPAAFLHIHLLTQHCDSLISSAAAVAAACRCHGSIMELIIKSQSQLARPLPFAVLAIIVQPLIQSSLL